MTKKDEAKKITETTFSGEFREENFKNFISNLFKDYERLDIAKEGSSFSDAFKSYVSRYKILGSFIDQGQNEIDILQVELQKEQSLERARTAQRNFIANYLKDNQKQAALVAFISSDKTDWRFSLVKLEYSLQEKGDKLITTPELTPAKRWSFLIGENEGNHTVKARFINLIESDQKPNLAEIEDAFSIEKVTNS